MINQASDSALRSITGRTITGNIDKLAVSNKNQIASFLSF